MAREKIQWIGRRTGKLTVLKEVEAKVCRGRVKPRFLCECDCGNQKIVDSRNLSRTFSCGCLRSEKSLNNKYSVIHGMAHSAEYRAWKSMKDRCFSRKNPRYKHYGGRGISVCDEWTAKDGFVAFLREIGKRPSDLHSLDRIDVNGNYEPGNVRWATRLEQSANKRNKRIENFPVKELIMELEKRFPVRMRGEHLHG